MTMRRIAGVLLLAAGLITAPLMAGWLVRTWTDPLAFDVRPIDPFWWSPVLIPVLLIAAGLLVLRAGRLWNGWRMTPRAAIWGLGFAAGSYVLGYLFSGLHGLGGLAVAFTVGCVASVWFRPAAAGADHAS